jgi:non-ribosomal peptide synthetase component F
LLYRYSYQTDIVLGAPVSGRTHADLEQQVGFYLNTLAVRTRLCPEKDCLANLRIVNENVVAAMAHQEYPSDELVEELLGDRLLSGKGLFDVMISLDRRLTDMADATLEGMSMTVLPVANTSAKFDISFLFTDTGTAVICNIEYSHIFDTETIAYLAAGLRRIAAAMTAREATPINQIEMLAQVRENDPGIIDFNFS